MESPIEVVRRFCAAWSENKEVVELAELTEADWQSFEATMRPNTDQTRRLGHYAVATRRRQRERS